MSDVMSLNRKFICAILGIIAVAASFIVIREGFYMDEAGLLSII